MMQTHSSCLLFLALLGTLACGGSNSPGDKCKDACPKVCEGQTPPTEAQITNCETACDALQARVEKRGCVDQQSALQDCAEENACKATFAATCASVSAALNDCYDTYCRAHTSDPDC